MTTPGHGPHRDDDNAEGIDLTKPQGEHGSAEPDFDPYRFGRPDHPVPPEYAPPGYAPETPTPPPGVYPPPPAYGQQPGQYPAPHPGQQPGQQFGQYPGQQPGPYPGQPPQWGQPYPQQPGYPPAPVSGAGTGKATTALVLGILSIVFCWLTFFDLLLIVPAVVFGIIGIVESNRRGGAGRGKAVAGLVCAVAGAILAIVVLVVLLDAADKCGGLSNNGDPGFQQCVQDNL